MIDWILIVISVYIIIKEITNFINKRTYVKAKVNTDINKNYNVYINLYDYKRKDEILPRAILKSSVLEERRLNKKLITSIDLKEKVRYKYLNF